jgi:hypothetical protein
MEVLESFVEVWLWADISCGRGRAGRTNGRQSFGYSFPRRAGYPKDIKSGRVCSEVGCEPSGNKPMDTRAERAGMGSCKPALRFWEQEGWPDGPEKPDLLKPGTGRRLGRNGGREGGRKMS